MELRALQTCRIVAKYYIDFLKQKIEKMKTFLNIGQERPVKNTFDLKVLTQTAIVWFSWGLIRSSWFRIKTRDFYGGRTLLMNPETKPFLFLSSSFLSLLSP
jgi:hypothetical protein